jgi:hypothetical protein
MTISRLNGGVKGSQEHCLADTNYFSYREAMGMAPLNPPARRRMEILDPPIPQEEP